VLVPVSGDFFRRLHYYLALACSTIFPKIVGVDKYKHRKGSENHDERTDKLPFHFCSSNPLSLPQYETRPKSF
jgi:hypothetical protein